MKIKINIADILKDKPVGLKFYSNTFGYISFNGVHKDKIYFFSEDTNAHSVKPNGKMYDGGECIIFPSKEMRDWEKFSWKKGDILVSEDNVHIIFEKFGDDTYTNFRGKYYLWEERGSIVNFEEDEDYMQTSDFNKANKEDAQEYIHKIEKELGGKLNMETLEIEKPQPEFKDGDIVYMGNAWNEYIGIIKNRTSGNQIETYAHCHKDSKEEAVLGLWLNKNDSDELRLATNSEKQQLFEALAKEGKAWDAEKKEFIDLKQKVEFKPFDKVLCRNSKDDTWEADFFARLTRKEIDYTQSGKYLCVGDLWMYCIPYNEETAHLLGTTDEWKGGEG